MYGGRILAFIVAFEWIHREIGSLERGILRLEKKCFQRLAGFGVLREMVASI